MNNTSVDMDFMTTGMEQNIQNNETNIESDTVKETENSNSSKKTQKEEIKQVTEEEEKQKAFETEMRAILQRIKELPTDVQELKIPIPTKDCKEIYSKLCKELKVREISEFISQLNNEKMDLSYQCLGPVGIIPVAKALSTCKSVKILDLKYNKLTLRSIPALISLIDQNENIMHLNLAGNEIDKGSSSLLRELISRCFTVEFLDLSNNNLGDEELLEIGFALMQVDRVKRLNLNSNDFSGAKAQPFGSCINKCSALQELNISCCHLEEGAMFIFGGLKTSNMTVLNLARNGIPDRAMPALASGLRGNKSLKKLDISYNNISNKGAVSLAPGLKGSSTLEEMILAHNPIQGSAATKLLASAGGNLKLLDLSGIRVDLAFFKAVRAYAKAGRDLRVLFGSEIRYDLFPRDLSVSDPDSLTRDNVMTYLQTLADEKGVSLRNVMKDIHASFLFEQKAKLEGEKEDAAKKKGTNEKKGTAEKKEATEKKDTEMRSDMTTEEFARALATGALAVPRAVTLEVAELLSEEGFVNMWNLIARIKWKPDDLNVKIKDPKKPDAGDKKKGQDKKKKK